MRLKLGFWKTLQENERAFSMYFPSMRDGCILIVRVSLLRFWHNWRAMNGTVRCMANKNMAHFYAPQTKIWEGLTKDDMRIFDGLFNGS